MTGASRSGLTTRFSWLGLRVDNCPAQSLDLSNEQVELTKTAPQIYRVGQKKVDHIYTTQMFTLSWFFSAQILKA